MNSTDKPTQPEEVENITEELPPRAFPKGTLEFERAHLLATLPDPDAGKSDDERREIVRLPARRFLGSLVNAAA